MSRSEHMAGVRPVDEIVETWMTLWSALAPLKAKYGFGGTWEHERKAILAKARAEARQRLATAARANPRVSQAETVVDDLARQSAAYRDAVSEAAAGRQQMLEIEATLDALRMSYDRHNLLLRLQREEQQRLPSPPSTEGGG